MWNRQVGDRSCRRTCSLAAALACLTLALGALPLIAQTGTLVGRVTDARSGAPVTTAQVTVTGTSLGAAVDVDGRFRVVNVPAGAHEVRARSIGYLPAVATFSVAADGSTDVNLSMNESATALDAVVITGAVGDTRRRAIGNAVSVVSVSDVVGKSSVGNVTEVLQSKVPGLTLMPGSGEPGTAANYRLRGAGSLNAGNSPTIYVDGVRVTSRGQGNYTVFGQNTSSLDAINPNDIESIEVIKGPAAATLYGAEAAAGVIQIITKKGQPGRVRWDARFETGHSTWPESMRPINYAVSTAARIANPVLWPGFVGTQPGDIISHRVMSEADALRNGGIQRMSVSASGGGDRYSFFVSGSRDNEEGVNLNNYARLGSLRSNFTFVPSTKLSFNTNIGYSQNHVRLPLNDNIAFGLIISSWLAIPGRMYPYPAGPNYFTIIPAVANTYDNQTRADRFILGTSADYRPFTWFSNKVRVGLDMNIGRAELYFPPQPAGLDPFSARASFDLVNTKGFIAEGRPLSQNITFNYDGTVTRELSSSLVSNSSFGVQFLSDAYHRTDAYGQDLGSLGIRSVSAAAVTTGGEQDTTQKSIGVYVQQQAAWRDRLFLTGAVRVDNNSAFGSKLNRVFYPKASLSYVISEEPFFHLPAVDELRLRAAWGQAGNSPGPFDAIRSYTTSVETTPTGTVSALRYGSVGNPDLRPERGSEIELGFESALIGGRLGLDVTYYNKTTRDALMRVQVPPSTGFAGTQLQNLGKIANSGFEMVLTATPLRRAQLTMESTLSLSTNHNRLVSFGDNRAAIVFGTYAPVQRYQEGYPLAAYWAQRVQYDASGKMIKNAAGQPIIDPVSVYRGPSVPTREMAFSNDFIIFEKLRLHSLFDYKGGHYLFNVKDWRRDRAAVSWATVNPQADPDEVLARKFAAENYFDIQKADFVKLRDLSLSYDLPAKLLGRVADRATLMFAGRNLKIWTKYGGADPEVSFDGGRDAFNRNDSWTLPNPRRYTVSLALGF
ncbi:MAG TPA: SusC/RagA family TonB-linked outer membrane protein [Gemmatimonadaceae bacterium]|nr:SusC/RagA family TonB-linked outer membrane protein [Gemmatimonadaceae bacterium]